MTQLAITDSKIKDSLNSAGPNTIADLLRRIKVGSVIEGHVPQHLYNVNPDALGNDAGNLATLDSIVLPDGSRAANIIRAYARTGTAGTGQMTVEAFHATPGTGEIAVAPNGNIVLLAADVITNVDILYLPQRGDVLESTFPVVSNALTIPTALTTLGVIAVLDVNAVVATSTGRKIVLTPGGTAAAGQAALNVAKTQVTFAAADAVTRATVKFLLVPPTAERLDEALKLAADIQ